MVNWKSRKLGDMLWFANGLVFVVLVNLLGANHFFRIDLTEEKRYSIKDQTKEILSGLDDDVYIEVFLEGDLNPGFRRLQKNIREILEEFRIYSGNRIRYVFTDPAVAMGQKARSEFMTELASRGIQPTNVVDRKDGQRVEKIIFPGAILTYGGAETGVMLLKGNKAGTSEQVINQSVEGVEYELASAIYKLVNAERPRVGFVSGHGELDSLELASLNNDLLEFYDVFHVRLKENSDLHRYDALIIAKPATAFSPQEKYKLDQYIMNGGEVMFLIDKLHVNMDSVSREDYLAMPYDLNLDDLLFRYGVRLNADLVQDRNAALYPVITGQVGGKPQVQLIDWPFLPLINQYADHPVTRNLDAVVTRFVGSIDTVKAEGIRKTPLMFTSPYARKINAPVNVSVNELRKGIRAEDFSSGHIPVGYILEGRFTSLFKNRFAPEGVDTAGFRGQGVPAKIVVIADGDIARNEINPRSKQPQALGFDPFTNYTFANRDLLLNAMAFLTAENGLIQARNREVKIRPLDREKVQSERLTWQVINIVLPVVLLVLYGVGRTYWRKRKFARF
jgi:gliding-associated putative ABC transporter substrate-binding component GldG